MKGKEVALAAQPPLFRAAIEPKAAGVSTHGIAKILQRGRNAFVLPGGDCEELACKIPPALSNRQRVDYVGQTAGEAMFRHSVPRSALHVSAVSQEAIDRFGVDQTHYNAILARSAG